MPASDSTLRRDPRGLLLGREQELGILLDALETADAGDGRLVLLTGEAGIGKTRLSAVFASRAAERGARVLRGQSWEAGGAPAYWPWIQALRAYLREIDPDLARADLRGVGADLAGVLPEIREIEPGLPEPTYEEGDAARFRLFEAISRFLASIAARRPLVVILDDLHAADEPSLLLLKFLAAEMEGHRLLVVAIAREGESDEDDARPALLAEIGRSAVAQGLALGGLTEAEVTRYIEIVSSAPPPVGVAAAVFRETEGNPLFVGEVVRLLVDEGRIGRTPDDGGRPLRLPAGVRSVIDRRLARLSEPCRELLVVASVLGVEFSLYVLAGLQGVEPEALLDLLDEGVRARAVLEPTTARGPWRFAHALIREVLYASLPTSDRRDLHLRTGEILEALHGREGDPPLAELAHHFGAAAAGERAIAYARRAAVRATEQYAHEEAARLYRLALTAGDPDETTRCELLLALGESAARAGDQAEMRSAFLQAAAIAERLGLAEDLGRAAVGYGGRLIHRRAGDDVQLVPLLERALAALPSADSVLRVRLLARLAGALRDEPDMGPRLALSAEALAMARRLGDPVTLSYALQGRQSAIWGPDALVDMGELLDEIEQIVSAAGDRERLAETHSNRVVLLLNRGADAEAVRIETEANARLALGLHQPAHYWYALQLRTVIALLEGRLADAEALLEETRRSGDRSVPWDADFTYRCGLVLIRREQGRLAEVGELIHSAVDDFPGYRCLSGLAVYVDAAAGREELARLALDALSRDEFAFLPRDLGWPFGMMFIGEAALLLGEHDRAAAVAAALRPYPGLFGTASGVLPAGPVSRVLGLLAADAGELDEALAWLDDATRASARAGARLWGLHATVEKAAILARRDGPGDQQLARELLASALPACGALGLTALEGQANAILQAVCEPVAETAVPVAGAGRNASFQREGDYWAIQFGRLFRLRDSKGLGYLALLLTHPGREFHALDLATPRGHTTATPASVADMATLGFHLDGDNSDGDGLDDTARAAYRLRLRELQAELDEAEAFNDPERAERARDEIEALERELSRAFGLGGRRRPGTSAAERARQSVTKAIRETLARIESEDAALGAHLGRSVRTGLYCSYDPDPAAAPSWKL